MQLCAVLQEALGLSEPPHFLVPCYVAAIDRWLDPVTQQVCVAAEASPMVMQHQALLNAVFGLKHTRWKSSRLVSDVCTPLVIHQFRQQFPQLWTSHDLVIRTDMSRPVGQGGEGVDALLWSSSESQRGEPQGYVLRLFISGKGAATEHILKRLHETLERSLREPYTLKVVDISKNPEQAEADQISATPTLVKVWPLPVKKVVGDLHNTEALLSFLMSTNQNSRT